VQNVKRMRGAVHGLTHDEKLNRHLNSEIASLSLSEDILRICKQHRAQFSVTNAVTALNRLAKAE